MPRRVVPLAVLAAVLVAGCGEERGEAGSAGSDPAADRRAVAGVVDRYVAATTTGRGDVACAQYARALRARDDARAKAQGLGGCAGVVGTYGRELAGQLPASRRAALLEQVRRPAVAIRYAGADTDRVLATVRLRGEQVAEGNRIELRREDGTWRIAELRIPTGVRWP